MTREIVKTCGWVDGTAPSWMGIRWRRSPSFRCGGLSCSSVKRSLLATSSSQQARRIAYADIGAAEHATVVPATTRPGDERGPAVQFLRVHEACFRAGPGASVAVSFRRPWRGGRPAQLVRRGAGAGGLSPVRSGGGRSRRPSPPTPRADPVAILAQLLVGAGAVNGRGAWLGVPSPCSPGPRLRSFRRQ